MLEQLQNFINTATITQLLATNIHISQLYKYYDVELLMTYWVRTK